MIYDHMALHGERAPPGYTPPLAKYELTMKIYATTQVRDPLKCIAHPLPETQLHMGHVGGILVPIGLFAFALAFTIYICDIRAVDRAPFSRLSCVYLHPPLHCYLMLQIRQRNVLRFHLHIHVTRHR